MKVDDSEHTLAGFINVYLKESSDWKVFAKQYWIPDESPFPFCVTYTPGEAVAIRLNRFLIETLRLVDPDDLLVSLKNKDHPNREETLVRTVLRMRIFRFDERVRLEDISRMNPMLPRRPYLEAETRGPLAPKLVLGYVATEQVGREMKLFAPGAVLLSAEALRAVPRYARRKGRPPTPEEYERNILKAAEQIGRGEIPEHLGRAGNRKRRSGPNLTLLADMAKISRSKLYELFEAIPGLGERVKEILIGPGPP